MTTDARKERERFIKAFRKLLAEKEVEQVDLAAKIGMDDGQLGFCLNVNMTHHFPASAMRKAAELLGDAVWSCADPDVVVSRAPAPGRTVAPVMGASVDVLREASELTQVALASALDGVVTTAEQAQVDKERDDVQRAAVSLAEATRVSTVTPIRS